MNRKWNNNREKPELLIPAKDLEVLRTAVAFGADAVYIGGEAFSLRAKARNFSPEDMREGIAFAHAHGVQVHVAANIYAHEQDLKGAAEYFSFLRETGPDAVLVADPGMFSLARRYCPEIPVHISTQANNTNSETFRFWHSLGAARVVCARELSLAEIARIRANTPQDLEIEAFIHGAMCISYSGRCLLSAWFTGRDANRGACTHPCRWKYSVVEEKRPGEYLPVVEDERGTYIFNSRDLCMIEHLPELARAGVDSLKIEGRMKTALYVASITRAYRRAIDDYLESDEAYAAGMDWYRHQIRQCTYRDFTPGFYFGRPDTQSMVYTDNTYTSDAVFLGIAEDLPASAPDASAPGAGMIPGGDDGGREMAVQRPEAPDGRTAGLVRIHQKNKFSVGDRIEIMRPDGVDRPAQVLRMWNADGEPVQSAPHPGEEILMELDAQADPGDLLRMHPGRCGG